MGDFNEIWCEWGRGVHTLARDRDQRRALVGKNFSFANWAEALSASYLCVPIWCCQEDSSFVSADSNLASWHNIAFCYQRHRTLHNFSSAWFLLSVRTVLYCTVLIRIIGKTQNLVHVWEHFTFYYLVYSIQIFEMLNWSIFTNIFHCRKIKGN